MADLRVSCEYWGQPDPLVKAYRWIDFSERVLSVRWRGGRQQGTPNQAAGSCRIEVDSSDNWITPGVGR